MQNHPAERSGRLKYMISIGQMNAKDLYWQIERILGQPIIYSTSGKVISAQEQQERITEYEKTGNPEILQMITRMYCLRFIAKKLREKRGRK